MLRRLVLLAILTVTASSIAFVGCSKVEETVSPFSHTTLTLTPQRFPAAPDSMMYALWAQKRSGASRLIGRFSFDDSLYLFRDANGNPRSNVFEADFSLLSYDFISVSVERVSASSPTSPGPIMLRDTVRSPEVKEVLRMKFPADFSRATGRVSMLTPSDGDTTGDRFYGLWFASYLRRVRDLRDTLALTVATRSVALRDHARDLSTGTTLDTLGFDGLDTVTLRSYSNYNLDTFVVRSVQPKYFVVPINMSTDTLLYDVGGTPVSYPPDRNYLFTITPTASAPRQQVENIFTPAWDFLPSLQNTGWHYKGWVLSAVTGKQSGPASFLRMNIGVNKEFNWEKEGRFLFTTGIFMDTVIDSSEILGYDTTIFYGDTSIYTFKNYKYETGYHTAGTPNNPHLAQPADAIPPFAGEDFLSNLDPVTPSSPNPYYFFIQGSDTAIAFVTVEPENMTDTTHNFPLIVLAAELTQTLPASVSDTLINQTATTFPFPDGRKGWPVIEVRLKLE